MNFPRRKSEIKKKYFLRSRGVERRIKRNTIYWKALNCIIGRQGWIFTGLRWTVARWLNGQSNDKCISYGTMSPADPRKIENKSCGIYIAGCAGHTGRNNVLRGCIRPCHCAGSKFLVQRSSGLRTIFNRVIGIFPRPCSNPYDPLVNLPPPW